MEFMYEVLLNGARRDSYKASADDPFVFVYRGTVNGASAVNAAWTVLHMHNADNRPDGRLGYSFSIGDAVRLIDADGNESYWLDSEGDFVEIGKPASIEREMRPIDALDAIYERLYGSE